MKRIPFIGLLLIGWIFNSCEFNQSTHKDLTTGAYSKGDGIGCDDIVIQVNGANENRNQFVYGERVNFVFENVTGLKRKNGKVSPGLSLYVLDSKKDTVLSHFDLLADLKKGTDKFPLEINANFIAAFPRQDKENYTVFIKIWDKKGEGTFQYQMPFTVKKNKVLKVTSNAIDYTDIYLWDETKQLVVANKNVSLKSQLILLLEGLDGLEVIEKKVFPAMSIEIVDRNGNPIISNPNLLEEFGDEGVDYDVFKTSQLPITLTFSTSSVNNPCQLKVSFTDLKSDRRIDISGELVIK